MTPPLDGARIALQHSRMRRLLCVAGFLPVLVAAPARAQGTVPPAAPAPATAVDRVEDSTKAARRLWPAVGLHYGSPLRFSGVLGLGVDLSPNSSDAVVLLAEPGQHGVEFSLGYVRLTGNLGSGYSLRASVLRTDSEPWDANPNATYVGAEAQGMLAFLVGGRAGVYRRVSGTTGEHDVLATVGLSIGM